MYAFMMTYAGFWLLLIFNIFVYQYIRRRCISYWVPLLSGEEQYIKLTVVYNLHLGRIDICAAAAAATYFCL